MGDVNLLRGVVYKCDAAPATGLDIDCGYGIFLFDNDTFPIWPDTLTLATADSTYPRWDVICIDTSPNIIWTVVTGTAGALDEFGNLAIPEVTTMLVCYLAYVDVGVTSISELVDVRNKIPVSVYLETLALSGGSNLPSQPDPFYSTDGDADVSVTGSTDTIDDWLTSGVMQRDVNVASFTIGASGVVDTNGYSIVCTHSFVNHGTLKNSGGNASGSTGGAAAGTGSMCRLVDGADGSTTTTATAYTDWGYGGQGGQGGGTQPTLPSWTRNLVGPGDWASLLACAAASNAPYAGGGGGGGAAEANTENVFWPSGGSNATYSGAGFTNPTNVQSDNGTYATGAAANSDGQKYGNFGFGALIPTGAIISKVQLEYQVKWTTLAGSPGVCTSHLRARISGTDQADHTNATEPTTDTTFTYDVTADRSWTRADLLDGTFEVACQATRTVSRTGTLNVDYIKVIVDWYIPGGGGGGPGGRVVVKAPIIDNFDGSIEVPGGNGADGTSNSCGGGGGGGGDIALFGKVIFHGVCDVSGGTQGQGAGTGADGQNGSDGYIYIVLDS